MLRKLLDGYRKLAEADAFDLLLHPGVLFNHYRFDAELPSRPQGMRSRPHSVEIELTNRCNLACIQCLRSQGLKPYKLGEITFEDFRKLLPQFPDATNLCLNGFGEPLLHPQFFEIVEWSRRLMPWVKISIYSNGILLDEARARRLVASGLTEINVSIDAASPGTYEKVRRGGDLETVHANLAGLLRARRDAGAKLPLVGVNFVLLNENEGELVPFIEQAAALGVDFVNCITYATYDWGFENRRSRESYQAELAAARRRLDELGLRCRSFPSADLSWTERATPFGCDFFWGTSVRVTFAGELTLGCCTPFKETFSYGNLLETPFDQLWNGPELQRHRALTSKQLPPTSACIACEQASKGFFSPRAPATVPLRTRAAK